MKDRERHSIPGLPVEWFFPFSHQFKAHMQEVVVKHKDFRIQCSFNTQSLAMRPSASYLISLSLDLLICKMAQYIASQDCWKD